MAIATGGRRSRAARCAAVAAVLGASLLAGATAQGAGAARPKPASPVTLAAVGDTILGTTPQLPSQPGRYLDRVRRQLRADVVFGNLEGTLTDASASKCGGSSGGSCFAFRNPPRFARALAASGFTVMNDANNHFGDFGSAGEADTVRALHDAGIAQTGRPGEIAYERVEGTTFAFLGFAPYGNTASLLDLGAARALIGKAARRADVVVVAIHAGAEGTGAQHVTGHTEHYLGENRGNPERFAMAAVRAGADLVLGSGPHVLRGMQLYRGRLIAYSLGNFAGFHNFDTSGVLGDSAILRVRLSGTGRLLGGRVVPVALRGPGRPTPGGSAIRLIRKLSHADFGASGVKLGGRGRLLLAGRR